MSAYFEQPVSELERLTNEVNACLGLVEDNPDNEYWQNRLANAIIEEYNAYHTFYDWGELYAKHLVRQFIIGNYIVAPDQGFVRTYEGFLHSRGGGFTEHCRLGIAGAPLGEIWKLTLQGIVWMLMFVKRLLEQIKAQGERIKALEQGGPKRLPYATADALEDLIATLNSEAFRNEFRMDLINNALAHAYKARNPNGKK